MLRGLFLREWHRYRALSEEGETQELAVGKSLQSL